ncbi:MAG: zinc ribbon domain-containing protein [Chloroflexota bacterium]|nr:zinc ribbon domain-containing protein [Chloroflexota bacterium]
MDKVLEVFASGAKLIIALGLAYFAALWFALIVWTYRDIEQRSRSVITQIFATLLSVLFFVPGALLYLVLRPRDTLDEAFQRSLEEEYLLQDLEDLPRCHSCHRAIESDWVICPSCHTELRHECPTCAHLVRVTWDICPYCATELEPAAAADAQESSIGRLMATIRERLGAQPSVEGRPGEPVYANLTPPQPVPVPIQHYQNGHQQQNPPVAPMRRPLPVENGRTETVPARPSPQPPGDPYAIDLPVEFGDEAGRRADASRNGTNGAHPSNGRNGYAPNGNGNGYVPPPAPRDGAPDEVVAQRNRPS